MGEFYQWGSSPGTVSRNRLTVSNGSNEVPRQTHSSPQEMTMANQDYLDHPNPDLRALAQMPEGEPLFPGGIPEGLELFASTDPLDIRETLMVESLRDAVRTLSGGRDVLGEHLAARSGDQQEETTAEYFLTDRIELVALVNVARTMECELEITFRPRVGDAITVVL